MSNQYKIKRLFLLILLLGIPSLMGCALGVTRVVINHDPLIQVENKSKGDILVSQFKDVRPVKEYIGNKRNAFGMVLGHIGTQSGVSLTEVLTKYFAEALNQAGYTVVVTKETKVPEGSEKTRFDAMVNGEIREFWMDLYTAVWHYVTVRLIAERPESREVLWEKVVHGEEKRVLWVGATGEYERIIRESLTKALNQAVSEFASDQFRKAIESSRSSSRGKEAVGSAEKPASQSPSDINPASRKPVYFAVLQTANIREEANTKSRVIATLKKGDQLEKIRESGNWYNVKLASGKTGWVHKSLVKEAIGTGR
jgi:hypothetical protein